MKELKDDLKDRIVKTPVLEDLDKDTRLALALAQVEEQRVRPAPQVWQYQHAYNLLTHALLEILDQASGDPVPPDEVIRALRRAANELT